MERREFLKTAIVAGSSVLADKVFSMSRPSDNNIKTTFPKRSLGKTGQELSIIGFGGIVVMNAEPEHAKKVVAEYVEKGIDLPPFSVPVVVRVFHVHSLCIGTDGA